jgi:hypothetical protein
MAESEQYILDIILFGNDRNHRICVLNNVPNMSQYMAGNEQERILVENTVNFEQICDRQGSGRIRTGMNSKRSGSWSVMIHSASLFFVLAIGRLASSSTLCVFAATSQARPFAALATSIRFFLLPHGRTADTNGSCRSKIVALGLVMSCKFLLFTIGRKHDIVHGRHNTVDNVGALGVPHRLRFHPGYKGLDFGLAARRARFIGPVGFERVLRASDLNQVDGKGSFQHMD